MIGMLKGVVGYKFSTSIILTVHDVGYKLLLPQALLQETHLGDIKTFFTYTYVREDALELFGFSEGEDLSLFEKLLSVSGIGPKTALNVFSVGRRGEILSAIEKGDTAFFKRVPRLGTKNAQKLIIELRGKLEEGSLIEVEQGSEESDIVIALENFGFKRNEVIEALKRVGEGSMEEKMKKALKELGR